MLLAEGIVLSRTPGMVGAWLKPNFSAVATSRAAPSLAPSGAKAELQDTAKALKNVPPHASPPAFCSVNPSIVDDVWIGNVDESLTMPASRAPVAVMIFIVEPGGCTDEKAIPASASRPPVRGSIAVMPAYLPPSALTAARSSDGTIVVC